MADLELLIPNWPAPHSVRAVITTRGAGVSNEPYDSLNLAKHVEDDLDNVVQNRKRLADRLSADLFETSDSLSIQWLNQVHGTDVVEVEADSVSDGIAPEADGCWTSKRAAVCALLTADCLPVLICDRRGTRVLAVHAGWRGLAAGIISNGLASANIAPDDAVVWLGPAIGPDVYQVGEDVRQAFKQSGAFRSLQTDTCFKPDEESSGRYLCNLYQLARLELESLGVSQIFGGDQCTFSQPEHFFSYRRDGQTGRFASLIWLV